MYCGHVEIKVSTRISMYCGHVECVETLISERSSDSCNSRTTLFKNWSKNEKNVLKERKCDFDFTLLELAHILAYDKSQSYTIESRRVYLVTFWDTWDTRYDVWDTWDTRMGHLGHSKLRMGHSGHSCGTLGTLKITSGTLGTLTWDTI